MNSIYQELEDQFKSMKCDKCAALEEKTMNDDNSIASWMIYNTSCACFKTGLDVDSFETEEDKEFFHKIIKNLHILTHIQDIEFLEKQFNQIFAILDIVPSVKYVQFDGRHSFDILMKEHGIVFRNNKIVAVY